MVKVYVCTDIWQFDSGDCGSNVKTFRTKESALEWLKNAKSDAISEMCGFLNADEIDCDDGGMTFSIWETGEYCYNHIDLAIIETEVE